MYRVVFVICLLILIVLKNQDPSLILSCSNTTQQPMWPWAGGVMVKEVFKVQVVKRARPMHW